MSDSADTGADVVRRVRERAREFWGDAFATTVCAYEDGTLVVEAHHVEGELDDGHTVFEELVWHSERTDDDAAYRRRTVSEEPHRARNETRQFEESGEFVDL